MLLPIVLLLYLVAIPLFWGFPVGQRRVASLPQPQYQPPQRKIKLRRVKVGRFRFITLP